MWSLDLKRLERINPGFLSGGLAIESGTCRGNGSRALSKNFKQVITIELSEELYCRAKNRLTEDFPNIEFINGNSASVLTKILPTLSASKPTFFFLDAHWSGDSSVDWSCSEWKGYGVDTAHLGQKDSVPSSKEQCPLEEELRAIVANCLGPAFLLIDDMKNIPEAGAGAKNLAFAGEDWSHLSREGLLKILGPRLKKLYELENPAQWFVDLAPLSLRA